MERNMLRTREHVLQQIGILKIHFVLDSISQNMQVGDADTEQVPGQYGLKLRHY